MSMSEAKDLIPMGIDVGSMHARVAVGHRAGPSPPEVISNAQGSRYTLALVGTDADAEESGTPGQHRYVFGDTARRALAREKKATISKDPSSMVRELLNRSRSDSESAAAAAAFVTHLTDASSVHPSKLRTVVSTPVASSLQEQRVTVEIIERGIRDAAKDKEAKAKKKMGGRECEDGLVMAIITDPAAVCIAHGLTESKHSDFVDLAAPKANGEMPAAWKHALVVDWAASGLTATHIRPTSTHSALLSIVRHVTDTTCSGTAITCTLVKYCASMFERKNRVCGVLSSQKACHRLEMACEEAVRTLSRAPTVAVVVDGLFKGIDMNVLISRPRFDMLMSGILRKAEMLLQTFASSEDVKFDVVLLAGNVCDMPSASNLVRKKLFPTAAVGRGDVPPDEAVAVGCARHAAAMLSCGTFSDRGGTRTKEQGTGSATRTVKTCPLTIGICRIEHGKEHGDLENIISQRSIPILETGDLLPINVTRCITCTKDDAWLSNSSIVIVQMRRGSAAKSKVVGKIEGLPVEDKEFEITMELSSAGKLTFSVNGGELMTL